MSLCSPQRSMIKTHASRKQVWPRLTSLLYYLVRTQRQWSPESSHTHRWLDVGNGLTEAGARWRGGYEMQCTSASLAPINTISSVNSIDLTWTYSWLSYAEIVFACVGWYVFTISDATSGWPQMQLPRCEKLFKESCVDILDPIGCAAANAFCWSAIELPEGEFDRFFRNVTLRWRVARY